MERYIIITDNGIFYNGYFDLKNCFSEGMKVIDLAKNIYTTDGVKWESIKFNHL